MFLVMGITGKVGGATAEHLLAHGKEVRALVRNREKAASWANKGVELVDGDWNDSAAIERALKGVEGAFVMLQSVLLWSLHFFAIYQHEHHGLRRYRREPEKQRRLSCEHGTGAVNQFR